MEGGIENDVKISVAHVSKPRSSTMAKYHGICDEGVDQRHATIEVHLNFSGAPELKSPILAQKLTLQN